MSLPSLLVNLQLRDAPCSTAFILSFASSVPTAQATGTPHDIQALNVFQGSSLAIAATPVRVGVEEPGQTSIWATYLLPCLNLTSEQSNPITQTRQLTNTQVQNILTPERPVQLEALDQQNGYKLTIMSVLTLSSAQKARLQQIDPVSANQIKSILTTGQYQRWLQMRRAYFGGR